MTCGVCGKPCAIDTHPETGMPIINFGQTKPRSLWFDAKADVDFCSAACSTAQHQRYYD